MSLTADPLEVVTPYWQHTFQWDGLHYRETWYDAEAERQEHQHFVDVYLQVLEAHPGEKCTRITHPNGYCDVCRQLGDPNLSIQLSSRIKEVVV